MTAWARDSDGRFQLLCPLRELILDAITTAHFRGLFIVLMNVAVADV
jgi:hypothetical protein